MTTPAPPPADQPDASLESGEQAPEPASSWVKDHEPPATEAERQAQETVRSVSRLEEAN